MRLNDIETRFYRWAVKRSGYAFAAFLIFLILTVSAAIAVIGAVWSWLADSQTMAIILAAAALLLMLLDTVWIATAAWISPIFRRLAYAVSRCWGRIGWHGMVLSLFVLDALLLCLATLIESTPWGLLSLRILGALVILLLLVWGLRARRRIVVVTFVNHSDDKSLEGAVAGLAPRLVNEFGRLTTLYADIDEMTGSHNETLTMKASVEDVGQVLQNAVSSQATLKVFGVLEIPVGSLVSVLGRFVQGPRLTGSLHKEGGRLLLIADLRGGGFHDAWRIGEDDLAGARRSSREAPLQAMIEQLAIRVWTTRVKVGSSRWEAVAHFTEGLRQYRASAVPSVEADLQRRAAERHFRMASSADQQFSQCLVNLGVVYRELGEQVAAWAALEQAVERGGSSRLDALFALARHWWDQGEYAQVVEKCWQMLAIRPGEARAWDLRAVARRRVPRTATSEPQSVEQSWLATVPDRTIATALAWRDHCRRLSRGQAEQPTSELAKLATRNLGVALANANQIGEGADRLEEALRLAPDDADLHFELAKVLRKSQRREEIIELALRMNMATLRAKDRAIMWAVCVDVMQSDEQQPFLEKFAEAAVDVPDSALEEFSRELGKLENESVNEKWAFIRKKCAEEGWRTAKALEQQDKEPAHIYAHLVGKHVKALLEGGASLSEQELRDAEEACREACATLDKKLIRREGLYGSLTWIHVQQHDRLADKLRSAAEGVDQAQITQAMQVARHEALYAAEQAVALCPDRAWERLLLADACSRVNDFDRAIEQLELALALEPSPEHLQSLGHALLQQAPGQEDHLLQEKLLRRAKVAFKDALSVLKARRLRMDKYQQQLEARANMHYLVGWTCNRLRQYSEAILHLQAALARDYKPLESRVLLAGCYVGGRDYAGVKPLLDVVHREYRDKSLECTPIDALGEVLPARELIAEIELWYALSLAEREVAFDHALELVEGVQERVREFDKTLSPLSAMIHECRGWVYFQRGDLDEAIEQLRKAAEESVDPEIYYRLARVYEAKVLAAEPNARRQQLANAREAGELCRHLDKSHRFGLPLSQLFARLHELRGEPRQEKESSSE